MTSLLLKAPIVAIIALVAFHIYIVSFHRLQTYEDYRETTRIIMSRRTSARCRLSDSGGLQCLPNVILIGASKCGTTSLVEYLSHHRHVQFVSRRIRAIDKHREVHRFDRNTYGMAIPAVELADEWASSPIVDEENTTVVHYTPHYIYAPTVPYEMKRFYPHADELKLVVILRDPIARAWSSYWFHNSHLLQGVDQGSAEEFAQEVLAEMEERRKYEACMETQLQPLRYGSDKASPPNSNGVGTLQYLRKLSHCLKMSYQTSREGPDPALQLCRIDWHGDWASTMPWRIETSSTSADTAAIEALMYAANKVCFGAQLRSPALGRRHLDKGVYTDQVLRWYASFRPEQFHFMTLDSLNREPEQTIQALLDFMDTPAVGEGTVVVGTAAHRSSPHAAYLEGLDFTQRRLERPNARMPPFDSLPEDLRRRLREYYQPYNALLNEWGVGF